MPRKKFDCLDRSVEKEKILLRFPEVQALIGSPSRSSIWRWIQNGEFPPSIQIGPNIVVWRKQDILDWIDEKFKNAR